MRCKVKLNQMLKPHFKENIVLSLIKFAEWLAKPEWKIVGTVQRLENHDPHTTAVMPIVTIDQKSFTTYEVAKTLFVFLTGYYPDEYGVDYHKPLDDVTAARLVARLAILADYQDISMAASLVLKNLDDRKY